MGRKSGQARREPVVRDDKIESEGPIELTLSTGQKISVYPISLQLWQNIQERFEPPPPPTREVDTVDGGTEEVPDPSDAEYQTMVLELKRQSAATLLRLVTVQALPDIELPEDDGWVQMLQFIDPGWEPAENLLQRKIEYLQYWLVRSRHDWETIIFTAISANALRKEDVDLAVRRFRDSFSRETCDALIDALDSAFV